MKVHSFTNQYNGLANVLMSDVVIQAHGSHNKIKARAIWDTGATGSVITKKYANLLKLTPVGKATVKGVNGTKQVNRYLLDVSVHPNVLINSVMVTESDDLSADNKVAMLIGMDIISLGDLAVTNFNGRTSLSFRIPSIEKIDFNIQRPVQTKIEPVRVKRKPGRNEPCPCGSGKKYKNCCGKTSNHQLSSAS